MPQEILRQVNFTGGELDPQADARRDTKTYFKSVAGAVNFTFKAQGPITRRPGFGYVDLVRGAFEGVAIGAGMVTAPKGGTAGHVVDNSGDTTLVTTASLGTDDPYVVLQVDLGGPRVIHAVDLIGYGVVAPGGSAPPPVAPPVTYPFPYDPGRYLGAYAYVGSLP